MTDSLVEKLRGALAGLNIMGKTKRKVYGDLEIDYGVYIVNSINDHAFSNGILGVSEGLERILNANRFRYHLPFYMNDLLLDGELALHIQRADDAPLALPETFQEAEAGGKPADSATDSLEDDEEKAVGVTWTQVPRWKVVAFEEGIDNHLNFLRLEYKLVPEVDENGNVKKGENRWFRRDYYPDRTVYYDNPTNRKKFKVDKTAPSKVGFVPFGLWKLPAWGVKDESVEPRERRRGMPFVTSVMAVIKRIDLSMQDVRDWNEYHSQPAFFTKGVPIGPSVVSQSGTSNTIELSVGPGMGMSLPETGEAFFLTAPDTIANSFKEKDALVDALQDITGVMILTDVSSQTSGEAIMRRQHRLDKTAESVRNIVAEELNLFFQKLALIEGVKLSEADLVRYPPLRTPSEAEIETKIRNLSELRDKGAINNEEFNRLSRLALGLTVDNQDVPYGRAALIK